MITPFLIALRLIVGAFFLLSSTAFADECLQLLERSSIAQQQGNYVLTATVGSERGMSNFTYAHLFKNQHSYTSWTDLDGEVQGYALRNGQGFNFNQDRRTQERLSWHPTLIFDRLMSSMTKLDGYHCVIAGRTRLSGHKATLLRLLPDDLRYAFVLAIDDEDLLPVQFLVQGPKAQLLLKINFSELRLQADPYLSGVSDDLFAGYERHSDTPADEIWQELHIPSPFVLIDAGAQSLSSGERSLYQTFSDGLVSFRVYRSTARSNHLPKAQQGTLSVLRVINANEEFAVVGEVSLELAQSILKNLI